MNFPARQLCPAAAFSLIEIMVVIGIFGIVLAMGAPTFFRMKRGEPMRQTVAEVREVCANARARAILGGQATAVVFHPLDGTFAVDGASDSKVGKMPGSGLSGRIDETLGVEMLDVNLVEFREAEVARVRFFPNGTADEFTLILHGRSDWSKLTLDPTTGLITMGDVR
jgi:prepilin-type N-terminal cleavage/methylation domain-containing protein